MVFVNREQQREVAVLPLTGLKILLIEDEPDMSFLFLFILEESGAEVLSVSTAMDALNQIDDFNPHLLISDLRLPDADGLWLIQSIRARAISASNLPAIAVSCYNREYHAHLILNAGFQAYLPKPCDPEGLVATIQLLTE